MHTESSQTDVNLDWDNLEWDKAVGKRRDCVEMIYTVHEHNLYGKNRVLQSGEVAYLCRLYSKNKCKSRLYLKNGRLYKKDDFIHHNHPPQDVQQSEFAIEKEVKDECGNLDALVNARNQSSAVADIFEKHMKRYTLDALRIGVD